MTVKLAYGKEFYHLQGQMINWCEKHVGPNPPHSDWAWDNITDWNREGSWAIRSMFGITLFYFKNERDATMFVLRWSECEEHI